jgi:hypothetical protein
MAMAQIVKILLYIIIYYYVGFSSFSGGLSVPTFSRCKIILKEEACQSPDLVKNTYRGGDGGAWALPTARAAIPTSCDVYEAAGTNRKQRQMLINITFCKQVEDDFFENH